MSTFGYHKTRPLQNNIDLSGVSLQEVMKNYPKLRTDLDQFDGETQATPEKEALWFYVQQHAMSLAERTLHPEEPLGEYEDFVTRYHDEMHWKVLRMFYYLLLICTRESRHAGGAQGKKKVFDMHPEMKHFHSNYVQDSSASSAIQAIIDNAPDVTLGEYTQFLVRMFTYPSYSAGYGGKAWKEIAVPLNEFVQGNISAEIMMDTAFTLEHNNGSMFNKGMLYNNYSGASLKKILDVQRSGQIPQLIAHHMADLNSYITQDMQDYVTVFSKLEPGFSGRVDWSKVLNIHGSIAYKNLVNATTANAQTWKEKLDANIKKAKAAAAKLALLKGSYEIMPGVQIPKGKRSQK
jgi:hypothetical protein